MICMRRIQYNKNNQLIVKLVDFQLIIRQLYKMGPNEILRCYDLEHERPIVLNEAHAGVAGGNYAGKETMRNIL